MAFKGKLQELFVKYGKVGLAVHMAVSTVSTTGFYVAIKNNVDVESLLGKIGLHSGSKEESSNKHDGNLSANEGINESKNQKAKIEASNVLLAGGGAFMLALLCNKALFPVRVPITIALTPPVAKFLARRRLVN